MFAVRAGIDLGQRCPVAASRVSARRVGPAHPRRTTGGRACGFVSRRGHDAMFIAGSSTTDRPLDTQ
jgi:hypothetical protein